MKLQAKHRLQAQVLNPGDVSAEYIKKLIGPSLSVHEWDVKGGGKVKAQIKTISRQGLIKTARLHITITFPNQTWIYYAEGPNGNLREVSRGKA